VLFFSVLLTRSFWCALKLGVDKLKYYYYYYYFCHFLCEREGSSFSSFQSQCKCDTVVWRFVKIVKLLAGMCHSGFLDDMKINETSYCPSCNRAHNSVCGHKKRALFVLLNSMGDTRLMGCNYFHFF
jgi:hypothetical protein